MNFNVVIDIWNWIKADHAAWPLRFYLEVSAWISSIGCALTMAMTVPHPPFLFLYPLFILGSGIFCWSAWTRKSFGMMSNYLLLVSIDSTALIRLVLNSSI